MRNPSNDAPTAIRKWLLRFAGQNPFHKPMWRVCLAQNVIRKSGGVFTEMPDGQNVMFDIDANGNSIYTPISPTSVRSGVMEVPRYPHEGWIMERWMPAHLWGSRQQWEAQRGADGSSLLGPYPSEGDYYLICGPFEKIPPIGDMELAIAQYECAQSNKPVNLENAINQAIRDERDAYLARKEKMIQNLEDYRTKEILPMFKRLSLSAQSVRNHIQKSVGLTSHFGVQ